MDNQATGDRLQAAGGPESGGRFNFPCALIPSVDPVREFLDPLFYCEEYKCTGMRVKICLQRRGVLSCGKSAGNTNGKGNAPCHDIECQIGAEIERDFNDVLDEAGRDLEDVAREVQGETRSAHDRNKELVAQRKREIAAYEQELKKKKTEEEKKMAKQDREVCSVDGCETKLRADSKGGVCARHRALKGNGKKGPKPKRKYTRRAKAPTKPKVRRSIEYGDNVQLSGKESNNGSGWEHFRECLGEAKTAIVNLDAAANALGPVVPASELERLLGR